MTKALQTLRARARVVVALVATTLAATAIAACGSSSSNSSSASLPSTSPATNSANTSSSGSSSGGKAIHVDIIADLTGELAPNNGVDGALAYIKHINDAGGVDGYHIDYQVLDAGSSTATALQAARRAVSDKPTAILTATDFLQSSVGVLASSGIPVIGEGFTPGWNGHKNLFAVAGDLVLHNGDAWIKVLTQQGRNKLALVTSPIEAPDIKLMKELAPKAGASVTMVETGAPELLNSATALSLAQRIKSSGANGVIIFGIGLGGSLIQADLNQLGADVKVIETSEFGPSVIKQYGPRANGMLFAAAFTSPYTQNDPGAAAFVSQMKQYGYTSQTYFPYTILRYAQAKVPIDAGLSKVGPPFSHSALISTLGALKNYTADGLLPNLSNPEFQQTNPNCLSVTQVVNGQWQATKSGSYPFICGSPAVPVPVG